MIYADHRESPSEVPKNLMDMGVPVKLTTLPVGDYILVGKEIVCVERKTTEDYVRSLKDRSLNNQLYNMSYNYPRSILILEGAFRGIDQLGITRSSMISSTAGTVLGRAPDGASGVVSMVPTDTQEDTALWLKLAHDRIANAERMLRLPVITKPAMALTSIRLAMSFPGIGEKLAGRLMDHFVTPRGFMEFLISHNLKDAQTELKGKIRGIGDGMIKKIYEAIDEAFRLSPEDQDDEEVRLNA